jgi:hypothetical protein
MNLPEPAIRALVMGGALGAWFWTQSLIGKRPSNDHVVGDRIHRLTATWHAALVRNKRHADRLLVASSLFVDALGLWIMAYSVFGVSIRPLIALLMIFGLRQICQALTSLPPPPGIIWRDPGFPSLLVTYGVSNDLFFSGHTAITVLGALVLGSLDIPWLTALTCAVAAFEIVTVLVLRAHYVIDVFTGAVVALWCWDFSRPLAFWLDHLIARNSVIL